MNDLPNSQNWKCADAINNILSSQSLATNLPWKVIPTTKKSSSSFLWHTQVIGQWVSLSQENEIEKLSIDTQKSRVQYEFNSKSDCSSKIKVTLRENKNSSDYFDDIKLKKYISKHPNGLIYVWSPHMNLSVLGVMNIQKSAKDLGLPMLFLVDPSSSEKTVNHAIKKLKLLVDSKRLSSFDLSMRSALVHYPTLFVIRDGKICDLAQRGFREANEYRAIITEIFGKCNQ